MIFVDAVFGQGPKPFTDKPPFYMTFLEDRTEDSIAKIIETISGSEPSQAEQS